LRLKNICNQIKSGKHIDKGKLVAELADIEASIRSHSHSHLIDLALDGYNDKMKDINSIRNIICEIPDEDHIMTPEQRKKIARDIEQMLYDYLNNNNINLDK